MEGLPPRASKQDYFLLGFSPLVFKNPSSQKGSGFTFHISHEGVGALPATSGVLKTSFSTDAAVEVLSVILVTGPHKVVSAEASWTKDF